MMDNARRQLVDNVRIAITRKNSPARVTLRYGEFWITDDVSSRLAARGAGLVGRAPDGREDPAERSDGTPAANAHLGPSKGHPGSPPPSPESGSGRACDAAGGGACPLQLRI